MTIDDTLGFVEDLVRSGFDKKHAEGLTRALRDHSGKSAITKTDLVELKNELTATMHELETRIIRWMVGLVLPVYAVVIAVVLRVFT